MLPDVSECRKGGLGINALKVLRFSLNQKNSLTSASVVRGVWDLRFESVTIFAQPRKTSLTSASVVSGFGINSLKVQLFSPNRKN
jgi:hypothetical protein